MRIRRACLMLVCLSACSRTPTPAIVPTHLGIDEARERRVATNPAALARIAAASEASGDRRAAATFYGRAAALAPDHPAYAIGQARALAEQGETGLAINALEEARQANPADATLDATLGRLLVVARRPEEAVALFRTAIAAHPDAVALLVGQGVAFDAERDTPDAQASYRRALALDPPNIAAANDLALSMALSGQQDAALASLQALRARVAEQGASSARLATIDGNLALIYGMRGDMRRAETSGRAADPDDLAGNLAFYSALAGGDAASGASGEDEVSGLPAPAPAPVSRTAPP